MIYVVVVNWRGYGDTIECLESLTRINGPEFKIIVVDNESSPTGVEEIKQWAEGQRRADTTRAVWRLLPVERKRKTNVAIMTSEEVFDSTSFALVTVVRMGWNSGFAHANNIGARFALSDPACDYVWFLNNDTVVTEGALGALLARTSIDATIGICGSTLLYYDTTETVQSLGGKFNCLTGRGKNLGMGTRLTNLPTTEAIEGQLEYVIGASMFVSRRFLKDVGFMDEGYFLYFEELNWSRRAKNKYRLAWARSSHIFHKEGASIGTDSRNRPSNLSLYYYNLNYLRFIVDFHPYLVPIGIAQMIVKWGVFSVRRDFSACRVFQRVMFDFFRGRRSKTFDIPPAFATKSVRTAKHR
jgi:GT2 family glycosyltransferase